MATRLSSRDGRDGIIAVKQRVLNGTATVSSPRHHVAGHGIAVATRVGGHTRGGRSHPIRRKDCGWRVNQGLERAMPSLRNYGVEKPATSIYHGGRACTGIGTRERILALRVTRSPRM